MTTTGCLDADIRHTIYLEPQGSVISEIVGLNVRSDSVHPDARHREEREFLDDLTSGVYEEALFPSGAIAFKTTLVRSERPYTVVMTARYPWADEFFAATFRSWIEVDDVDARLEYLGDAMRLVVSLRTDGEGTDQEPCDVAEAGNGVVSVMDDLDDSVRIILTEGRFVEAEGFEIEKDEAIPLPEKDVAIRRGFAPTR